jgi:hypothetical protein
MARRRQSRRGAASVLHLAKSTIAAKFLIISFPSENPLETYAAVKIRI